MKLANRVNSLFHLVILSLISLGVCHPVRKQHELNHETSIYEGLGVDDAFVATFGSRG